jgi:hypothetical protein
MSDVPNHGEFLFMDTDRTTKDVRLLSATEVTEQCEKAKEAYKKLKNTTYVPLPSLVFAYTRYLLTFPRFLLAVLPDHPILFSREMGDAGVPGAGALATGGPTRSPGNSFTVRRRRTTTTGTESRGLRQRRNEAEVAVVAEAAVVETTRRRRTPSSFTS